VLPDVPSAPEAGLPKMIMQFWVGYAVPAGTPQAAVERLNQAIAAVFQLAESKKRFTDLGLETVGNSPAQPQRSSPAKWSAGPRLSRRQGLKRNSVQAAR
jgi:tripartite-type tricarboxylate transporter receptor subunit TctC